jgi:hypothetical protein
MDELDEIARTEIQKGWVVVVDADGTEVGHVGEVHGRSFTLED